MKKIFLIALFATIGANAQKINPVQIGIDKVADSLSITVISFKTTDKSCGLYYQVFNDKKLQIDQGNLQLTEDEFCNWGESNTYIEDLALAKLKLTRKTIKK